MVLVKDHKLSFGERFFFKSIVTGLLYTFGNIFKKKVTRLYPEVKLQPTASFHGVPVLVKSRDGKTKCVACGLCEFACPPRAIHIIPEEIEDPIERGPKVFEINMLRCIECGYCEEACPKEAIVMSQEYELVGESRGEMVWGLDRLLVSEEKLQPRLEYIRRTFKRFQVEPRTEATAETVPGKGGTGAGVDGTLRPSAARRYRDGY